MKRNINNTVTYTAFKTSNWFSNENLSSVSLKMGMLITCPAYKENFYHVSRLKGECLSCVPLKKRMFICVLLKKRMFIMCPA